MKPPAVISTLVATALLLLLPSLRAHSPAGVQADSSPGVRISSCPEPELAEVQREFSSCQAVAQRRFDVHATRAKLCRFLDEMVTRCTRVYARCFSDRMIRMVQGAVVRVQVDRMLRLYGVGEIVLECPLVRRHLNLTAADKDTDAADAADASKTVPKLPFKPTDRCDVARIHTLYLVFRQCGARAQRQMHIKLRNSAASVSMRRAIVCDTLATLLDRCNQDLNQCYDLAEVVRLREDQKTILATLFFRLTELIGFSAQQCPAFQESRQQVKRELLIGGDSGSAPGVPSPCTGLWLAVVVGAAWAKLAVC